MNDWKPNIERVHEIPGVTVSSEGISELEFKVHDELVKLDKETLEAYRDVFNKDTNFFQRFKRFLTAQNKAGRRAKTIKDFILIFVPFGERVNNLTEMVSQIIKDTMPKTQAKSTTKSSQMITFFVLFVLSLLSYFGVDLGFEISQDAEMVGILTSIAGMLFRVITNQPVRLGKTLRDILGRGDAG